MHDHAHAETLGGIHIRIEYDTTESYMNPRRDCDNFGTMICFHRRYDLGDEHSYNDPLASLNGIYQETNPDAEDFDTIDEAFEVMSEKSLVWLPLYLYDHSGITMNTTGFSCPWDSGQVGIIYATYDTIKNEFGEVTPENIEKALDLLRSEVKHYDHYIRGECYCTKFWKALDEDAGEDDYDDEELLECYGGFIGELSDCIEEARSEARGFAEHAEAG